MDTLMNFTTPSSDVAFSPSVKAIQARKGSREAYGRMEAKGGWRTTITPDLEAFIAAQTSVYLATASADGQPYIQHRGGPPGFLHVVDNRTITFADYAGNRQYITQGNLAENAKAQLFLMGLCASPAHQDLGHRACHRGCRCRGEPDAQGLRREGPNRRSCSPSRPGDSNCPQHIPQKFDAADVAAALEQRDRKIAALEAEVAQLKQAPGKGP